MKRSFRVGDPCRWRQQGGIGRFRLSGTGAYADPFRSWPAYYSPVPGGGVTIERVWGLAFPNDIGLRAASCLPVITLFDPGMNAGGVDDCIYPGHGRYL